MNAVSRGKQAIDLRETAGQVRDAFKTELHTYSRDGVVFHANNSDPQITSAFAPVIAGFGTPERYLQWRCKLRYRLR